MSIKLVLRGGFGRRLTTSTVIASRACFSLTKRAAFSSTAPTKSSLSSDSQRKPLDLKESVVKDATKARFKEFDLANRAAIITGGAQGLGLAMAEVLVEAGGHVYCLDRASEPSSDFLAAQSRANTDFGGSLNYDRVDVTNVSDLDHVVASIASKHNGINGLIAAAGIQQVTPALEYSVADINRMLAVNFTGVFSSAKAVAKCMIDYNVPGSIVLIASISGLVANHGLITPVYNSSKAAVIQLARNLAMEWAAHGIRVNSLCPGHIQTPMVAENFRREPHLKPLWEGANMLKRLSKPEEFRGAALFLVSDASSFMTGGTLVIDGGHTAW